MRCIAIMIALLWTHQSDGRYPEDLISRALSRNHTTPTDLIASVWEWILRPNKMNMNQLIECRDSIQNVWSQQCRTRIRHMLSLSKYFQGTGFTFKPSKCNFVFELYEHGNPNKTTEPTTFAAGSKHGKISRPRTKSIQIICDIFARTRSGRLYAGNFSIIVKGCRLSFSIYNQSVSIFGYKWGPKSGAGFEIDRVKITWYPIGYTVTDIHMSKPI